MKPQLPVSNSVRRTPTHGCEPIFWREKWAGSSSSSSDPLIGGWLALACLRPYTFSPPPPLKKRHLISAALFLLAAAGPNKDFFLFSPPSFAPIIRRAHSFVGFSAIWARHLLPSSRQRKLGAKVVYSVHNRGKEKVLLLSTFLSCLSLFSPPFFASTLRIVEEEKVHFCTAQL